MKKFILINIFLLPLFFCTQTSQAQSLFSSHTSNMNTVMHDALIYPNPVVDNTFKVKSDDLVVSVDVINVIGQTIKQTVNEYKLQDDVFVALDECEKGMYLVKITFDDNKSIIKKMLVK